VKAEVSEQQLDLGIERSIEIVRGVQNSFE
jgi:hypothetical protein